MIEFITAGGPIMYLLLLTSIVGFTFIIERGLALRWEKVIPEPVEESAMNCRSAANLAELKHLCQSVPSPLSRLLMVAGSNLARPREDIVDALETRARHEVLKLERGLVILEIVVGIAPLLGLVGTVHGLITLFGDLGSAGLSDNAKLAKGIAVALNTTLAGLLIAIPSLVAWSYYTKKVETFSIEMETICDDFIRHHGGRKGH